MTLPTLAQQAFLAFTAFETSMIDSAVDKSVFYTTDPEGFKTQPVVICNTQAEWEHWLAQVNKWHELAAALQEAAPDHFPRTSKAFDPAPVAIGDVAICRLMEERFCSSEKTTKYALINSLERHLAFAEKSLSPGIQGTVEQLRADIEFFTNNPEEHYRIRREGYVSQRLHYTNTAGERKAKHAPHRGMFLFSGRNGVPLKFAKSQKRESVRSGRVYDLISPIPTALPIRGKIYSQSAVDEMEAKLKKERQQKVESKKTDAGSTKGLLGREHPELVDG